jgi:hypothetical protein
MGLDFAVRDVVQYAPMQGVSSRHSESTKFRSRLRETLMERAASSSQASYPSAHQPAAASAPAVGDKKVDHLLHRSGDPHTHGSAYPAS